MNSTDILSPKKDQVKSLISMSATTIDTRDKPTTTERKTSNFKFNFTRPQA